MAFSFPSGWLFQPPVFYSLHYFNFIIFRNFGARFFSCTGERAR